METSDHIPCVISISTKIPSAPIFRFENYWMDHENFLQVVQQNWVAPTHLTDATLILSAKFKNLRRSLKIWKHSLFNLKTTISNVKLVISFLILIVEFRDLSLCEWNFKEILQIKLQNLLKQQKTYWKQRGQIKWVTLGDASTKFFHAHATVHYRKNLITHLENDLGVLVTDHQQKELLIQQSFKERLGVNGFTCVLFNLDNLLHNDFDVSALIAPFSQQEIDSMVKALPSDKAPGPDGFNTNFVKKCWPLISHDFY